MIQNFTKQIVAKQMRHTYDSISFYGVSSAKSVKPFMALELINVALLFNTKENFLSENEVKIAAALSLINEKKVYP